MSVFDMVGRCKAAFFHGLLQEVFTYRRKGIQQGSRFQTYAAVHDVGLFVQCVARPHDMRLVADSELKFTG